MFSTHAQLHTLMERVFVQIPTQCRAVYKFIARISVYIGRVRKYSAKRHNITVHHNNGGEIVTLVEYLVSSCSGRYQPSHPSWYARSSKEKRIHNFGAAAATVAD